MALFSCSVSLPAQGTQELPTPTLKASAQNVVLDVVVTDASGSAVTGLKRGDFRVIEDGAPQTVLYFHQPQPGAQWNAEDSGRAVIVLDALNSKFEDFGFAVDSVKKLLRRSPTLPEPTSLMLLTYNGLKVLQNYTTDSGAMLAALDKRKGEVVISLQGENLPLGEIVGRSLGGLEQLARANIDSGYRQSILWVSPGINSLAGEYSLNNNLSDFVRALSGLSDEMLRSRTTLDAVDPRGVGAGQIAPRGLVVAGDGAYNLDDLAVYANNYQIGTSNLALSTLTSETGGTYLYNRNDIDAEIDKTLRDAASAYTLAYSPINHNFNSKFRRIKIELTRPGLVAHTRPGYFALPDSALSPQAMKYEINHAVTSQVNYSGIALTVAAQPVTEDKQPITVAIDTRSLQWHMQDDGAYHAKVELLAVSFSAKQKALYSVRQTMSATLPAPVYQATLGRPWKISMDLPFDKAESRVRVVVRDVDSGRIGSAQAALQ